MEQKYRDRMEDHRRELLETIPGQLLEASQNSNSSPHHTDPELDQATDFLDAHKDETVWKHKLMQYVALKEAVGALEEAQATFQKQENLHQRNPKKHPPPLPLDFPEGKLEILLDDHDLLEEMLVADGPSGGNWGKVMEIYQEILEESDCVDDRSDHPVLHRLAVAIALVHATPVKQMNALEPPEGTNLDEYVDPVRRYLNYEVAFLEGDLDPAFDTLTVFELRFVVDGDEPDEVSAWGRKTLLNFFPDHVTERKPDWLYAGIVRSDIPYGSSRVKDDEPRLQKYQNILRNGGICGRRAFFGRFILRSFGIPTTARPSKGHAALCHWTPVTGEWVINLGGKWGKGWTKTRYVKDLDFEATTRARNSQQDYHGVKLAQWIGDLFGEKRVYGIHSEKAFGRGEITLLDLQQKSDVDLWYRLSLKVQETILNNGGNNKNAIAIRQNRAAAAKTRSKSTAAPVTTIVETACKQKSVAGKCWYSENGTIIRIPASSYANPRKTKDVKIMKGIEIDNSATTSTTGGNQQIYLPSFKPEGTTILRGGTWKDQKFKPGSRLLSDGKGKYEDWGFRVALSLGEDDDDNDDDDNEVCPEPELVLELGGGGDSDKDLIHTMDFVYIPPGRFVMGGTRLEDGRFKCVEVPHHPVEITKGFYLGKYPVTQAQYEIISKKNPSKSTKDEWCPVDTVGADDALRFCQAVSEATGAVVRLPTEAEWEYAARGSTDGNIADPNWIFGDSGKDGIGDYAWFKDNADGRSHPVGKKKPNPFGLHDIYGNVRERVSDTYHKDYYAQGNGSPMVDPTGPSQGSKSRFRYEMKDVPAAGTYCLTAKVCTINPMQHLKVVANPASDNDVDGAVVMKLPYTVGDWKESDTVRVQLTKGDNTLHFWRDANPPQYGLSVREFVLTKAD